MTRPLKIIVALLVIGVLVFTAHYILRSLQGSTVEDSQIGTLPTVTTSGSNLVFSENGGVTVRNFIPEATDAGVNGLLLFEDATIGTIYYNPDGKSFRLFSYPEFVKDFRVSRPLLEQKFLTILGVSEADACKLTVFSNVSSQTAEGLDGVEVGLSFCPNSVPTP